LGKKKKKKIVEERSRDLGKIKGGDHLKKMGKDGGEITENLKKRRTKLLNDPSKKGQERKGRAGTAALSLLSRRGVAEVLCDGSEKKEKNRLLVEGGGGAKKGNCCAFSQKLSPLKGGVSPAEYSTPEITGGGWGGGEKGFDDPLKGDQLPHEEKREDSGQKM